MKITLVRHAQTEENFLRVIQGRANKLLNDSGRRQVLRLKLKLKNKKYDLCFVSPLTRCMETALVSVGDRVRMISDDRLLEREVGEFEGRPDVEYNAYKYWDYDLNKSDFGVEPIQDVFKRCSDFLEYIKKEYPDKDIIVVTHSAPYRALRHLLLGHKLKGKMLDGRIDNCQVEEFEIKK